MRRRPPRSSLFPYTTLFRSALSDFRVPAAEHAFTRVDQNDLDERRLDLRIAGQEHLIDEVAHLGRNLHARSEEHTSELQSQSNLVCRLLLEKKNSNATSESD